MVYLSTTDWFPRATQQACGHLLLILGRSNFECKSKNVINVVATSLFYVRS